MAWQEGKEGKRSKAQGMAGGRWQAGCWLRLGRRLGQGRAGMAAGRQSQRAMPDRNSQRPNNLVK